MDDKIESDKKSKDKTYQVYENKGQLKVTVPRVLGQAVGITKGSKVKWIIDRGELVMKKI
jgi:hypothetical protein